MRASLFTVCILLTAATANAGPIEDANFAYDKGDFPAAERLYRVLAVQGERTAQVRLGIMYDEGHGIAQI